MNKGQKLDNYRIARFGMLIMVQQERYYPDGNEWDTISTARTVDKIDGKTAKTMTDEELLASWSPTSKNWSH
jgi:hypothetical protein